MPGTRVLYVTRRATEVAAIRAVLLRARQDAVLDVVDPTEGLSPMASASTCDLALVDTEFSPTAAAELFADLRQFAPAIPILAISTARTLTAAISLLGGLRGQVNGASAAERDAPESARSTLGSGDIVPAGTGQIGADDLLATMLEGVSDGFLTLNRDWIITYVTSNGAAMIRQTQATLSARRLLDVYPEMLSSPVYRAFVRAMSDREPARFEAYSAPLLRWFEGAAYPHPDGIAVYFRDVSERRRAVEQLRRREEQLRAAVNAARVRTWEWDIQTGAIRWAEGTQETSGPLGLVTGGPDGSFDDYFALIHPDDRAAVRLMFDRALESGAHYSTEYRYQTPGSAGTRWMHSAGEVVFDEDGKPLRMVGAVTDITDRKMAEAQLRLEHEAIDSAIVGLAIATTDGRLAYANRAFIELWGLDSSDEAIGVDASTFLANRSEASAALRALRRDGRWVGDLVGRRNDGTTFTAEVTAHLIQGGAVSPDHFMASFVDVTAKLATERELEKSEELLRQTVGVAKIGIFDNDHMSGTVYWSPELRATCGWGADEPVRLRQFLAQVHPDDMGWVRQVTSRSVDPTGDGQFDVEHRIIRRDGEIRWIEMRARTLFEGEGDARRAVRTVGAAIDVTERRANEEGVRNLNAVLERRVGERTALLEEANKELETFTYSVSHDLKAPLRGIEGYSRLLMDGYQDLLDDDGRMFLRNVRTATAQMSALIDDLLAYSRFERRDLARLPVELADLVGGLLGERSPAVEAAKTRITVSIMSGTVIADRDGLGIALRNLLDNAIKFSAGQPEPAVEIGARTEGGSCLIWVRDNGIGFDMKFHDRIFEVFQRLQRAEEYPGTGLGLAIVQKAMDRMGGRVWAESEPGRGATLWLELPA